MGILLALLLGVAAAFFVLAMPIRMLESVTTFTRLSKLMIQAEPPISPNDRTLLSVLAGILTAGIGWVLVDWLIFGRAGISTLIRTREDDYEDEEGGNFRPTDPLDLVTPAEQPGQDWAPPQSGDARRPLSARTDIGDPPAAGQAFGAPPPFPDINRQLPPIGEILPGAGVAAPPLQPNALPPVQPLPQHQPRTMISPHGAGEQVAPFDPVSPPAGAGAATPSEAGVAAAAMPTWLPAPGARAAEEEKEEPASLIEAVGDEPPAEPAEMPEVLNLDGTMTPPVIPEPVPPLMPQPPFAAPVFETREEEGEAPPAPEKPSYPIIEPVEPSEPPAAATPEEAPVPERAPLAAMSPPPVEATPRPLLDPGYDRARLEELLGKLEHTLRQRRAAAAAAEAEAAMSIRPVAPPRVLSPEPAPPPSEAPVAQAPRDGSADVFAAPPPSLQAAEPPAPPVFDPAPARQEAAQPPEPAIAPAAPAGEGGGDRMLDQPLHVTLDMLRNMVRR